MKLNLLARLKQDEGELIASFGDARLVRHLSGKFELLGGREADRADAKEWCSLFLHEAVFISRPSRSAVVAARPLQPQRA